MVPGLRALVSKRKRRYREDGFDLDLSYIADRIIAMGFPSLGMEAMYRNPLEEVQRFFNTKHPHRYRIYNLCSEREYGLDAFEFRVESFPFDDHNPCALEVIGLFCHSVDEFLIMHDTEPRSVVGIHCKAGKGRTGLMVSCYLLHCGLCDTAREALDFYAERRTYNKKGITIPSQIRYVYYYEQLLKRREIPDFVFRLTALRIKPVPNFDGNGGCNFYVIVKVLSPMGPPGTQEGRSWKEKTVWNQLTATGGTIQADGKETDEIVLDLKDHDIQIHGNIKVAIFDRERMRNRKIGAVWFHTAFVETNYLKFDRSQIDKLCKAPDSMVPPDFGIELFLHRVADDKDFHERMSMVAVDMPEHDIEEDHIELAEDLDEELKSAGIAVHELTTEKLTELERRLSLRGLPM